MSRESCKFVEFKTNDYSGDRYPETETFSSFLEVKWRFRDIIKYHQSCSDAQQGESRSYVIFNKVIFQGVNFYFYIEGSNILYGLVSQKRLYSA